VLVQKLIQTRDTNIVIKHNFIYICTIATENAHAKFTKNQDDVSLLTQTDILQTEVEDATQNQEQKKVKLSLCLTN
jgi:hypothetical protein